MDILVISWSINFENHCSYFCSTLNIWKQIKP